MPENQAPSPLIGVQGGYEATVRTNPIIADDQEYPYDDDGTEGLDAYLVKSHYEFNRGLVAMPVCKKPGSGGDDLVFAQAHAPIGALVVEWSCQRTGEQPDIPNPNIEDGNTILLGTSPTTESVTLSDNGDYRFGISGVYRYAFRQTQQSTVSYPVAPFVVMQQGRLVVLNSSSLADDTFTIGWPSPGIAKDLTGQ